MKKNILAAGFLLGMILTGAAWADSKPTLFDEANTLYETGKFEEAIALYQKDADTQGGSAALFYNMGNAYYRVGQRARALLSYERALRGTPRDADLLWNKSLIQDLFVDRLEDRNEFAGVPWFRRQVDRWTINEISMLWAALLLLLAATHGFIYMRPDLKRWLRGLKVIIWVAILVIASAGVLKWLEIKDPRVVITDKEIYVRYGPSLKEPKAFLLHEGAEGRVVDHSRDWLYVVLGNKGAGWIPKSACEVI